MVRLEELKQSILDSKIKNLYIFYGEDYAIRKHYINKICESFTELVYLEQYTDMLLQVSSASLFKVKKLFVVIDDMDFLELSSDELQQFKNSLDDDNTIIFVYNNDITNEDILNIFADNITKFPAVTADIAMEFVEDIVKISEKQRKDLAYECNNLYGNILYETDKVHTYSQAKDISEEQSYESLKASNQLVDRLMSFEADIFIEDYLTSNRKNYYLWFKIIENDIDGFCWSLNSMYRDILTASLIKQYGKWDGSTKAYNYGFYWGRIKIIRDLDIKYTTDFLYQKAHELACIDSDIKNGILNKGDILSTFMDKFF